MAATIYIDDLLTTKETAAVLGVSTITLEMWRSKRKGPPFVKLGDGPGAAVRYRRSELAEWLSTGTRRGGAHA